MLFAVLMVAALISAAIAFGVFIAGIWGGIAFAVVPIVLFKAFTHQSGPDRPSSRDQFNAFQGSLSDD